MKTWKLNKTIYAALMQHRHTDLIEHVELVEESSISVKSALTYLKEQSFPLYQPTKSRVVAILYAYLVNKYYPEESFESVLNDPELLTEDRYFVPFSQDKEGYQLLLVSLPSIQSWAELGGWIPRTMKYFWMECMTDGIDFISLATDGEIMDFLDNGKLPIALS